MTNDKTAYVLMFVDLLKGNLSKIGFSEVKSKEQNWVEKQLGQIAEK